MHTQELVCESTYRGIHGPCNLVVSASFRGLLCSSLMGHYSCVSSHHCLTFTNRQSSYINLFISVLCWDLCPRDI